MSEVFASVVVLTRNRLKQLERCLQSLRGQSFRDFEVIVIDTGSTDGTPDWLRRESPLDTMQLIETREASFASARNEGVEAARGDWIAFVDDDCVAARTWLECLSRVAERYDAVGGLVLPLNPLPLPRWWHPDMGWLVGLGVPGQLRRSTGSIHYPSTSNLAVRRALLVHHHFQETEATFDTSENVYRCGREDAELWRRLRRIGYRTQFLPEMMVWHDVPVDRFQWRTLRARARADGRALWERERPHDALDDACREIAHYYWSWPRRRFASRAGHALQRLWMLRQSALVGSALANLPRVERWRTLGLALGQAARHVIASDVKRAMRPVAVWRQQRRHPREPLPPSPRCLAVVAFGFLGDMVIVQPACRAFHEAHPGTRMILVTHPMGDLVHRDMECWERRVVLDPAAKGVSVRAHCETIRNELTGLGVDAVVVPYYHNAPPEILFHTTHAGILTFDADVGFPRRMWYELATARVAKDLERQEVYNIAALLQWWGPLAGLRPYRWRVLPAEANDARTLLRLEERPRRHLVALHTGSVLPYKRWPLRHWNELAARLGQVENLDLVFVGDDSCLEVAGEIIRSNRIQALNLCGRLSVRMLAAVLAEVSLLVTADSGPKHVAFAVGTPTVTLYGHSAPERWGPLWERHKHVALRGGNADLTARETDGLPPDYLLARISPKHVYETIRALFEGQFISR